MQMAARRSGIFAQRLHSMITFQCPNGHSLSCPSDRAGRKARCPKCEAEVTVPEATDQVEKTGSSLSGLDSDDSIAFLCPNGHKLNGPAAMQGKPGQCPHCKERFIIPDYEEPEELDEFADSRLSLSDVGGFDDLVAGSSLSTGGSMATSSSGTSSAGAVRRWFLDATALRMALESAGQRH